MMRPTTDKTSDKQHLLIGLFWCCPRCGSNKYSEIVVATCSMYNSESERRKDLREKRR